MTRIAAGWPLLCLALILAACGPREFGAGRTGADPPPGHSDSFRPIAEGEDEVEGVAIADDSDEAFDDVESENEEWYEEGQEPEDE